MAKVCIIGAGKIGVAVKHLLLQGRHQICVIDINPNDSVDIVIKSGDKAAIKQHIKDQDIVISCAAYHANLCIAEVCAQNNIAYFDATEDVGVTNKIKKLSSSSLLMPQCGLAPGAVNIIANHLIQSFNDIESVNIRVGALPLCTTNMMHYYLTWSTDGLMNEYCQLVDAIIAGQKVKVQPLDGLETIYIDGCAYEAFYTSGGIASMCDDYEGKIDNINYKTIRYPGHHAHMKFLLDDLNLKTNQDQLVALFNNAVPYVRSDVVIILVTVKGYINGRLEEIAYHKKIYGNGALTAIQLATASGICAVVQAFIDGKIIGQGFQSQSQIPFDIFTNNSFGALYAK